MRRRSSRGYGEWEEHRERERATGEGGEIHPIEPLRVNFRVLEVRGRVECVNGTHRFTDLNR